MSLTLNSVRALAPLSSMFLTLLISGCGEGNPWSKVYPVKGTVSHNGKPIKDAELAFFPLDEKAPESVRPWAKSSENGEFSVSTYNNGDGAPAGRYKVTVVHHEIVVSKGSMGSKPNDLPQKYATKESTDLVVEVGEEATILPALNLK